MVASLRPKKVLEFGAGLHSTPFFLQDPELTRIVSVEADNEDDAIVQAHEEFTVECEGPFEDYNQETIDAREAR